MTSRTSRKTFPDKPFRRRSLSVEEVAQWSRIPRQVIRLTEVAFCTPKAEIIRIPQLSRRRSFIVEEVAQWSRIPRQIDRFSEVAFCTPKVEIFQITQPPSHFRQGIGGSQLVFQKSRFHAQFSPNPISSRSSFQFVCSKSWLTTTQFDSFRLFQVAARAVQSVAQPLPKTPPTWRRRQDRKVARPTSKSWLTTTHSFVSLGRRGPIRNLAASVAA